MIRLAPALLLVLCCAVTFADDAKPNETKPDDGLRTLKAQPLKIDLELTGKFESDRMTPVRIDLDEWNTQSIKVADGIAQGTRVKAGDVLIRFETEVLDRLIDGMAQQQALAKTGLDDLTQDVAMLEQTVPYDIMMADRNLKQVTDDYDRYQKTERQMQIDEANQSLRVAERRFEYVSEELRQLEKMYNADDLTEETEEIVLTRQKNSVQEARYSLDRTRYFVDKTLKIYVPRVDKDWEHSLSVAKFRVDRTHNQLPTMLAQKKQTLAKMRFDYDQTEAALKRLRSDRDKLIVKAPADGVVYYGRYEQGQWKEAALIENVINKDGGFRPGATLMTIVAPEPRRIGCTIAEKDLYKAHVGATGWAIPTGYPDRPAEVKLEAVNALPIEPGQYPAALSVKAPDGITAGMGCKITLPVYRNDKALVLPPSAINIDDPTAPFVKLVDKDGKHVKRPVKLGWRDGERIEITGGLKAGDKVVLDVNKRDADKD